MIDLLGLCRQHELAYHQVVEVGVNHPRLAQVHAFLGSRRLERAILVEPLARHVRQLRICFRDEPRVKVVQAAVCDRNRLVTLYDLDQSAFLSSLPASPAMANGYFRGAKEPKVRVKGITFDKMDDGNIDVLAADVEGAEWFILEHMRSRPGLLCLETHLTRHPYINPYLGEINAWMRENGYMQAAQDRTDTAWVRRADPDGLRTTDH